MRKSSQQNLQEAIDLIKALRKHRINRAVNKSINIGGDVIGQHVNIGGDSIFTYAGTNDTLDTIQTLLEIVIEDETKDSNKDN